MTTMISKMNSRFPEYIYMLSWTMAEKTTKVLFILKKHPNSKWGNNGKTKKSFIYPPPTHTLNLSFNSTYSIVICETRSKLVKSALAKLSLYWPILIASSQSSTVLKLEKSGMLRSSKGKCTLHRTKSDHPHIFCYCINSAVCLLCCSI